MIDFPSHLLNWRRRHNLTEREAGAVLGVSVVAIIQYEKPGFSPPVEVEIRLMERMDLWNKQQQKT